MEKIQEQGICIGRVIKPHGLRGEVRLFMDPSITGTLHEGMSVVAELDDGGTRNLEVDSFKVRSGAVFIRFKNIDDRSAAEELRGSMIVAPMDVLNNRGDGQYFAHEFEGMTVYDRDGSHIGTILRVESYPANEVFIVDTGESEIWVPAIRDFILEVDTAGKRVVTTRTGELPFYPKGGDV